VSGSIRRRRFRRSLRSPAEWWFARCGNENKGGIGQTPATAGAPRRPCFPFSPLARRTIPQATSGAGGISASQGQNVAVTSICEDADASIEMRPSPPNSSKNPPVTPDEQFQSSSHIFTILQLLCQNPKVLYQIMQLLYI
jgi:hypothetical protein